MDSSGGPPPPEQGPWPGDTRMASLQETADSAGPCATQRPHGGGPLPVPVSYSTGLGGGGPQAVFQGVVSPTVSCSPKPLEQQPPMNQGGPPMGPVPLQPEPTDGAPVPPWLLLPQRHQQQQQQHLYYEGQQVVQQQLHQQRPPVLQQGGGAPGPHNGEAPHAPVNMGELPPWQPSLDCSAERGVSFGCASPCMMPAQAPPPYGVSPLASGPFVGDVPHISTQQHLQQWQPGAAAQNDALQPPPAAAAAPPGPPVAQFPFGMCMGAPQGPSGGLKGCPEGPTGGGPWQPMQQQQHHQQQQQHPPPQQQRAPQQSPQQPHVSGLQQPGNGGVYAPMGLAGPPLPKAESRGPRPPKSGGTFRRKADSTVEGGGPPAPSSGTRPAKFFKQHSPGKGAPKPRSKGGAAQGVAQEDGAPKDSSQSVSVGCHGAPGGPPPHGGPVRQAPLSGHKQPSGAFEKGEGGGGPPKATPRPRAVRPSEVMAKMYFHRKKEAWRAELLIEGTKKQKSFSCRLYGYERARLMCEWARKFVLRTSRLPTDEETCTSLASLMKEPLPPQVPPALPYGHSDAAAPGAPGAPGGAPSGGAPGGTQVPLPSSGEASQGKNPEEEREQQAAAAAPASVGSAAAAAAAAAAHGTGGVAAREGPYGGDVGCMPSAKGPPLEPRASGGAGVCKKRKDAAKSGENTTKVRKGSDCPGGGASSKKGQAPRGATDGPSEGPPLPQGPRRVARNDLIGGPTNGKVAAPGDNRAEGPAPMVSPHLSFKNPEASAGAYTAAGGPHPAGAPPAQELPLPECASPCLGGAPRVGGAPQEEAPGKSGDVGFRAPDACGGEGLSPSANPWFEELEQLKKISRPKGGRAKRFNVGKKPFSGVRGIYFQQGLWKVKYRGEQEEAMKLFPYSPGVRSTSTESEAPLLLLAGPPVYARSLYGLGFRVCGLDAQRAARRKWCRKKRSPLLRD